jgi:aryl-alcohol dehydrogenase-like predicted oxidoreductase
MRYVILGRTGMRVSELCLGTMLFGDEKRGADAAESRRIFEAFLEAGGNFVDTANHYVGGRSEEILGDLIAEERERLVVGTKYTLTMQGNDPNASGNHRKNMVQSVERSLRRLKTDYIDLYWVHAWDFLTPAEEVMRGMDDLVRAGKVLHVAVSDTPAWIVARANTLAAERGWTPFCATQVEYSLVERTSDRELIPMATASGMTTLAWSPLGAGVLTGKYLDGVPADSRLQQGSGKLAERNLEIARKVAEVASGAGCTPSQVAIAWLRARGIVPIIGVRTHEQAVDNLGAVSVELSGEVVEMLSRMSTVEMGFPHDLLSREAVRWRVYGDDHERLRPDSLA